MPRFDYVPPALDPGGIVGDTVVLAGWLVAGLLVLAWATRRASAEVLA